MERLIRRRSHRWAREAALLIANLDIPAAVEIGPGLVLQHRGQGVVITPRTRIGSNVMIYQQVTIGRAAVEGSDSEVGFEGLVIEDEVVLCAGAKVLGGPGVLTVGRGSLIAANAVLTKSTGQWEVWGGVPARKIGDRKPSR